MRRPISEPQPIAISSFEIDLPAWRYHGLRFPDRTVVEACRGTNDRSDGRRWNLVRLNADGWETSAYFRGQADALGYRVAEGGVHAHGGLIYIYPGQRPRMEPVERTGPELRIIPASGDRTDVYFTD